jgi:hypothetical protein
MTIVGHGRIHHAHLPADSRQRLYELAGATPQEWGLLFVLDGHQRRWTLYSADPDYTTMFAPAAHSLALTFDVGAAKFPCWDAGWRIN